MEEMKPCPFCGKDHIVINAYEHSDRDVCKWVCSVFCANCFAGTSNHGFDWTEDEAKEKAVKAWNRRTSDDRNQRH